MLLRTRYLARELVRFFVFFIGVTAFMLLVMQVFWSLSETVRGNKFPWRDFFIYLHSNILLVTPAITLVSVFFVISELGRFSELEILQIKGINPARVLGVFFSFGLVVSALGFVAGSFPPYPEYRLSSPRADAVSIISPRLTVWAEKTLSDTCLANVLIILRDGDKSSVYQAERAYFSSDGLILTNGTFRVVGEGINKQKEFASERIQAPLDPKSVYEYVSVQMDRVSYFRLRSLLCAIKRIGIFSKKQWIILYQKLSYPLLNFFIIFLSLPFFYARKGLSRFKIFSMTLGFSLVVYFAYAAGIAMGENDYIPWRAAPWTAHFLIVAATLGYLLTMRKSSIIHPVQKENHFNKNP